MNIFSFQKIKQVISWNYKTLNAISYNINLLTMQKFVFSENWLSNSKIKRCVDLQYTFKTTLTC